MALDTDLEVIPKIYYATLRNTVQSGDILFYSGEDEVSKLIRWATNSIWSHVGIILKVESIDRVLLLESVENQGVRLIPVSKYIRNVSVEAKTEDFAIRLVIARHKKLSKSKSKKLLNFGLDQITQPYDREEIQRIIQRIILGEGKAERDNAYMCSELVYECFLQANIEFKYNKLGFISPEDIWKDEDLIAIAEIESNELNKKPA
jgi:uncharacterized protein YycO